MILIYFLLCAGVVVNTSPTSISDEYEIPISDVHTTKEIQQILKSYTQELESLGIHLEANVEEENTEQLQKGINKSVIDFVQMLTVEGSKLKKILDEKLLDEPDYKVKYVKNIIFKFSQKMFDLLDEMAQAKTDEDTDKLKLLAEEIANYTEKTYHLFYESYTDEKLQLAVKNIKMAAYLYILRSDYFEKLAFATNYLTKLAHDSDICSYNNTDDCSMAYMPDIHKVIRESDDESEIKYYWTAWREQNQEWGELHLGEFIKLFKKAATLTNVQPLDLWYKTYLDSEFLNEMEQVMEELKPFYTKIHAYIRFNLIEKYGEDIIPSEGPIPHHLYYQVLLQNWKNNSYVKTPYPEYSLPDFDTKVENMVNITGKDLLTIADEFFKSLGIEDVDATMNDDELEGDTENVKSGENDCKAEIYSLTPMYSITTCPQINFRKYLQTHAWTTPTFFVAEKKGLPFAHFQSYNFEYPTGEAVILSASSPKHLHTMGIITEEESANDQFIYNRLFKMSVHTMLKIPSFFVHSKVMNDLLSGKIELDNVNEYYWKLMKQYAGVVPPVERSAESFDFPHTFYEDLENNHQTAKFLSEVTGYQIYQSLCKIAGTTDDSLHNCDFYGVQEVGEKLMEFMRMGSTKPWRDVLAVVTNDNSGLKAQPLLDYYQPIDAWLQKQIKEKNLVEGW